MEAEDLAEKFEDKLSTTQGGGGKVKVKGGRKGGPGGGGGKPADGGKQREKQVSMALSRLLRHQALNAGITLDKEGYAPLNRVLQWGPLRSLGVTVQEVIQVTADNEKQRFSMKPANPAPSTSTSTPSEPDDPASWLIRANQGHSIKLESEALLKPITLEVGNVPEVVVHGTYFAFWPRIVEAGGLRRMGRTHVHCSTGLPEDEQGVISGMRKDAEVLVYVDVRRSLEDGAMTWWVSDNGVVLTEGAEGAEEGMVPARYFREVVGRREEESAASC
ncbi:tRNA 2'-phosphotransferase 1 [Cytospora mali]|uniref:2'-phosphotransferase n=1 Tax=Cytospora mali TaxID=578113 RepID=A0A194V6Q1_CYTMA|nr:tRNA 2'-phosphotransferase 1 [Valsa mali var. pyri (nom. inval.)]